jgi:hypothetical protein
MNSILAYFTHRSERFVCFWGFLFLICTPSFGQDYTWWNDKHQWDGKTPWNEYIITSAAYMGPNALPVPTIQNGQIPSKAYFQISGETHISIGDKTQNLQTELFLPLFSKRVGLHLSVVPIEYFKLDTLTRDLRRVRERSGEGFAYGDVYISTYIQLIENHLKWPDILVTINLNTASGNKLGNARFTDSPGYFFDMSFGKKLPLKGEVIQSLRPHLMLGFYAWQMHTTDYFQNDAFLYGFGLDWDRPKFDLKSSLGGYVGYIGNGDKPMVYRMKWQTKREKLFNYSLSVQQGLKDFSYTSFRFACLADLEFIYNKMRKNK